MPFVQAKCPKCGGMLAVDADKKAAVCQFCGEAFIVQEAINNYNTYNETINNYNTTHQYGVGAVVNVYENQSKDFVIEAGVLKEYHGESANVTIPKNVKVIGSRCFWYKAIEKVTIQEGVTEIGYEAFSNCKNLKYIEMPKSVIKIDNHAFESCSSLINIELSDNISTIGSYAFCNCIALTDIELPNNVSIIDDYTFANCNKIHNIKIPDNVTKIGWGAFENCESMTMVYLPKSLKEISFCAFDGCKQLTQVIYDGSFIDWIQIQFSSNPNKIAKNLVVSGKTVEKKMVIPNEIPQIGIHSFEGIELESITISNNIDGFSFVTEAIGLREIIVLYENDTRLISRLLGNKSDLVKQVLISNSINEIGVHAFENLRELTSVDIPENIIEIGNYAFNGCSKLVDVKLPNNIKIGVFAFSDYWQGKELCRNCGGELKYPLLGDAKCKICGMKKDY